MSTPYKYTNAWGDIPALHAVCTFLPSHTEKQGQAMEIGYFLCDYAENRAADVREARAIARALDEAERAQNPDEVQRLQVMKKQSKVHTPCIIPAMYYRNGHNAMSVGTPSGVLCVDIDRHDNTAIPLQTWGNLPAMLMRSKMGKYIAFIGESRSGWALGGYFVLIVISGADNFPARYSAIERWFNSAGIKIDPQAKNINHCRALSLQDNSTRESFAPLPEVNANAIPYAYTYTEPRPRQQPYTGSRAEDFALVQSACRYIVSHGIVLTEDFREWTQIAFAFASSFGAQGEDLFLQVASTSAKYRQGENIWKYRNALRTCKGSVSLRTFWYLCKQNNVQF